MLAMTTGRACGAIIACCLLGAIVPRAALAQAHFSTPVFSMLNTESVSVYRLCVDVTADGICDIILPRLQTIVGPGFNALSGTPHGVGNNIAIPQRAADLNADGHVDVVALVGSVVQNFFGNSTGNFVAGPANPPNWLTPLYPICDDLDADGNLELIHNTASGSWVLYTNVGGNWVVVATLVPIPVASGPSCFDTDGDGLKDLVRYSSTGWGPYPITQYTERGLGGLLFAAPVASELVTLPGGREFVDVDNDGYADMIDQGWLGLNLLRGSPLGFLQVQFIDPALYPPSVTGWTSQATIRAIVADFNGDKHADLLFTQMYVYPVAPIVHSYHRLHCGIGGQFSTSPLTLPVVLSMSYSSVEAADFDNDGDIDIAHFVGVFPMYTQCNFGIAWNQSVYGRGISGTGVIPGIGVGAAYRGNAAFAIGLDTALPGAAAVLGLSLGVLPVVSPAGNLWLSLSPGQLLAPNSAFGVAQVDALGRASIPLPLPLAMPVGTSVYAQWAVLDPMGQLLLSGVPPVALSPARKIICWQ